MKKPQQAATARVKDGAKADAKGDAKPPPPPQPPKEPPPKRPKGRQPGIKPPKVKVETAYQEERLLSKLEQIQGQITELKRFKTSVEAGDEQSESKAYPNGSHSKMNKLREKKAGHTALWQSIH